MKVLKGMALGLVGFFLFIALPILGLAFTINSTVLNPQFIVAEIEKLDITTTLQEILAAQMPSEDKTYLMGLNQSVIELKPWITEHISEVIHSGYDYLLGSTDTLQITISTEPVKQSLIKNLTQAYVQSPPPEYLQLSPNDRANYLNQIQQGITQAIPTTLEINQATIGPDNMRVVQQAKDDISYFHTGYFYLLAFSLILILLMIWIMREVKGATRVLGIIFLIDGALSMVVFLVCKQVIPGMIPMSNFPSQIQTWLPQVARDLLAPWGMYNLAILAIGVILLVVSFIFRNHQSVPTVVSPA